MIAHAFMLGHGFRLERASDAIFDLLTHPNMDLLGPHHVSLPGEPVLLQAPGGLLIGAVVRKA